MMLAMVAAFHGTLEGIGNFRAVSPTLPGIYRSAGLERATAYDAASLLDGARIRTIVDLRNDDEIEKAAAKSTSFGRALCGLFDSEAAVGTGCAASEGSGTLARVRAPLLRDTDAFMEEVAARLSGPRKAEAMAYKAFSGKKYDALLYDEIARNRHVGLNTVMLATGRDEIGRALRLVAERRRHGAVLFHCAQGKDRTGVLAALLQHVAGDGEAAIVEGYAASEAIMQAHAEGARAAAEVARVKEEEGGVDWSALRGSPPEAMTETLAWIRHEHGSIDGFLAKAVPGDAEAWRRSLLAAVRTRA